MAVVAVVFEEDAQICRASSVPVLVEPGHLDRLQDALVRRLRVVREAGQLRHLVVHVVQAHLPPQLCCRSMLFPSAMSRIEPGRPSSCSGNLAGSTSTVTFMGRNVTL